ncbi:multisubunit sodium/proton antiporter, MrpA subunit /multisubunit sodium/proton antiporter, MrpB subunit [Brevibacterium antiquum CNRZ 918]|uniref:Multisubunit sodium/proton antiporter, MrpA subunit /multisubunit sodium/proton antiporter, MrpB subunit n=2 Tax=Brevibacteriaceae TaxID=85019 RepID=A0A2H1KJR4_9MICO|nr:multisubunit sodium/proton antiporter, MrpA subunit /multisubunit sodium/proton antiporter, MrpB subunit [Brevibacterium antiquum CNRZ 918]
MIAMTGAFFGAAVIAFPLVKRLGRNGFFFLALVPLAGLILSLAKAPAIVGSAGSPWVESMGWLPALGLDGIFRLDELSWIMSLLVTGVGALVFVYCARYFPPDEPGLARFAGVFMAFAGMMYGLVLADELLMLYLFWEGTTVFSYLLIGHSQSRRRSRQAALQALIVTTAGGLAMLVGMILLMSATGTGQISALMERASLGLDTGPIIVTAVILILVGAVSKSALIPFHFWLPGAMAAPTPVSAYLHAAAMVKAGIYLVLRLSPGYHALPGWSETLLTLGLLTMFIGGWQALKQTDLKLLLAFGTVSQLGFLTTMASFGTPDITKAALAMLIAHALFKACLFLCVGIIDHRAGTRDLTKLSGGWKAFPIVAVCATIAAASMAGLPPLFGFVAKEAVYSTLLSSPDKASIIALIGIMIGSMLTVAYSARFVWGAFSSKDGVDDIARRDEKITLIISPIVLTALTVGLGPAAGFIDGCFAAWTSTLPVIDSRDGDYHLALWHGLEPALALSAVTIAVGLLLFFVRDSFAKVQSTLPSGLDFHDLYSKLISWMEKLALWVTSRTQRGSLPFYQSVIYLVLVAGIGLAVISNDTWNIEFKLVDTPLDFIVAAVLIIVAVAATRAKKRFTAVVVTGISGYAMVAYFAFVGAPDLALTQVLVETITIVVFVLVLRRLPARIGQSTGRFTPAWRAIIGAAVGVTMMFVVLIAAGVRVSDPVSVDFGQLAYEVGHGKNIVNVTLVDIRVWDTLGEISVLVAAGTGIAGLIFVRGREGHLHRFVSRRDGTELQGRVRFQPVPEEVGNFHDPGREDVTQRRISWLIAGRTLAPRNRSIILEVTARLIFHAVLIFSLYLLFAGHNEPGGGFAGGLVAGLALVVRYLAGGKFELAEAARFTPSGMLGTGMIMAVLTGVGGWIWGDTVFKSVYLEGDVPVLGHLSFGTSTLFDIGVYLIVVGLMLDILRSLGAEVDLHQERDEMVLTTRLNQSYNLSETFSAEAEQNAVSSILDRVNHLDVDNGAEGGRL